MGDAAHSVYVLGRPPLRALPAEASGLEAVGRLERPQTKLARAFAFIER